MAGRASAGRAKPPDSGLAYAGGWVCHGLHIHALIPGAGDVDLIDLFFMPTRITRRRRHADYICCGLRLWLPCLSHRPLYRVPTGTKPFPVHNATATNSTYLEEHTNETISHMISQKLGYISPRKQNTFLVPSSIGRAPATLQYIQPLATGYAIVETLQKNKLLIVCEGVGAG